MPDPVNKVVGSLSGTSGADDDHVPLRLEEIKILLTQFIGGHNDEILLIGLTLSTKDG